MHYENPDGSLLIWYSKFMIQHNEVLGLLYYFSYQIINIKTILQLNRQDKKLNCFQLLMISFGVTLIIAIWIGSYLNIFNFF